MILKRWWLNGYVKEFEAHKRYDPYHDLESYMNWEPGAWNDRGWIIAEGDGLFAHRDRYNLGQ